MKLQFLHKKGRGRRHDGEENEQADAPGYSPLKKEKTDLPGFIVKVGS